MGLQSLRMIFFSDQSRRCQSHEMPPSISQHILMNQPVSPGRLLIAQSILEFCMDDSVNCDHLTPNTRPLRGLATANN